jgi:alpha-1,2-mannosyltransferase
MLRTAAGLGLIAFAVVIWLAAFRSFGFDPTRTGSDAWNYLAAGERLNAGHPLYALSPGDRPVPLAPPYWSVPLVAPPPIAVAWRPLALLGESSMVLWAGAGLIATILAAGWLLARGGLVVAALIALFAIPLAIQSVSGNANAFLLGALVLAWIWRDRAPLVGTLVAVAIAVKLTPVLLVIWLAAAGRRRAVLMTGVALAAIGVLSLAGAGIQNHLDWLASLPGTAPAPTSIAGLAGFPAWWILTLAVLLVVVVALRGDERLTFSVAVLAAAFASPALYLGTLGIAAAAAAPWVGEGWAMVDQLRGRTVHPRPTGST